MAKGILGKLKISAIIFEVAMLLILYINLAFSFLAFGLMAVYYRNIEFKTFCVSDGFYLPKLRQNNRFNLTSVLIALTPFFNILCFLILATLFVEFLLKRKSGKRV